MPDFPRNPIEKEGYQLEFNDDFDSPKLNLDNWIPYYLPHWSSRERSAPRYHLDNSNLILRIDADQAEWCPEFDETIRCSSIQTGLFAGEVGSSIGQHRFKEGLVVRESQPTQFLYTPQYGYFEARIKAVRSSNTLVALWLIGTETQAHQSGEITVFEVFGNQMTDHDAEVRYGIKPIHDPQLEPEFFHDRLAIDTTDFHLYAIEWTPTQVDFYIDNEKRQTVNQSPNYPMQFMLNIYDLPIEDTLDAPYPREFVVDYVRGYQPIVKYD
ncbi:MAG: glycoside hydrolase family 16 protein, partial [Chloroflexota bacterium]